LVLDTEIGKCSSWEVNIAGEASDAFCGFTEVGLGSLVDGSTTVRRMAYLLV